jgi:AhpD family alkylhydroperoxidase
MTFDRRTEELVAIGASVGANCEPCLRFHAREAQESGASGEEIAAAIAVGQRVRKGAAARVDEAAAAMGGAPASKAASQGGRPGCCG